MLNMVMPGARGGIVEHGSTWEGKIAMPRGRNNRSSGADKGNHVVSIKRKLNHNDAEYSYNSDYYNYYGGYNYYYGYYSYGQSYYYDSDYETTYSYYDQGGYDYYNSYDDYWYYSYDYYYYYGGYYDSYYGQNSYYDGHEVKDGNGNSDVNADFTGAQDWDDWHEAEG